MIRPTTREGRRKDREAVRGHLALVIAEMPSQWTTPSNELMDVATKIMATFNVSRKAKR